METAFSFAVVSMLAVALAGAHTTATWSSSGDPARDAAEPIAALNRVRRASAGTNDPAIKAKQLREIAALRAIPRWQDRLWNYLDTLVVEATWTQAQEDARRADWDAKKAQYMAVRTALNPDIEAIRLASKELDAVNQQRSAAVAGWDKLRPILNSLFAAPMPEVARVVGPLLSTQSIDLGDGTSLRPPAWREAWTTMGVLQHRGLLPADAPSHGTIEDWRRWWAANAERFGPPYRLGVKVDLTQPSTPPTVTPPPADSVGTSAAKTASDGAGQADSPQRSQHIIFVCGILGALLVLLAALGRRKR
jgi:hypothetical protein